MLYILLTAQRMQREARWAAEAATAREHHGNHAFSPVAGATASQDGIVSGSAVRDCVDRVVSSWDSWMAQTDRWRVDLSNQEGESYLRCTIADRWMVLRPLFRYVLVYCLGNGPHLDISLDKGSSWIACIGTRI